MNKKSSFVVFSAVSAVSAGLAGAVSAATITSGDLLVYRVGNGSAALSSAATAVFLDEYTPTGTLVQSIPMPTATAGTNNPLTASGTATSEGGLSISGNGQYILATGYAAVPGTSGVASSSSTTVPRVVARVDLNANVDTSTTTTQFTGNNIRTAASQDGSTLYLGGANSGIISVPFGGAGGQGTVISNTSNGTTSLVNYRQLAVFANSLYASDSSGTTNRISLIGSAGSLPTTTGQVPTELPGINVGASTTVGSSVVGPYQFFLTTLDNSSTPDVLYVADNGYNNSSGNNSTGAIEKFILSSGSWTADGTAPLPTLTGITGIQTNVAGVTVENLYATTPGGIYELTDTGAALTGSPTEIVAAGTNTAFRGIVAVPEPTSLSLLAAGGVALLSRRKRRQTA